MILLDTNVISEVMKANPSTSVLEWLNAQTSSALFVSAITIGEIEYGLRILPRSKRRGQLSNKFDQFISSGFAQRVLNYDETAARAYGDIMSMRKEIGRPMSVPDGQIAGIARVNGFGLATRDLRDFEHCGIDLVNPFVATS